MKWFIIHKNDRIGPYSSEEIRQRLKTGELSNDSFIVREGSPLRRKIGDVLELISPEKKSQPAEAKNEGFAGGFGQTVISAAPPTIAGVSFDSRSASNVKNYGLASDQKTVQIDSDQHVIGSNALKSADHEPSPLQVAGFSGSSNPIGRELKSGAYESLGESSQNVVRPPQVKISYLESLGSKPPHPKSLETKEFPEKDKKQASESPRSLPPENDKKLASGKAFENLMSGGQSIPLQSPAPTPYNSMMSSSMGESQVRFINPARRDSLSDADQSKISRQVNKQKLSSLDSKKEPFALSTSNQKENLFGAKVDESKDKTKKPRRHKVLSLSPGSPSHQQPHLRSEADFNSIHAGRMNWERHRVNPTFQKSQDKIKGKRRKRSLVGQPQNPSLVLPGLIGACLLVFFVTLFLGIQRSNAAKKIRSHRVKAQVEKEYSPDKTASLVEQEEAVIAETLKEQRRQNATKFADHSIQDSRSQATKTPENNDTKVVANSTSTNFPSHWPTLIVKEVSDLGRLKFKTVVVDNVRVAGFPQDCRPCQISGSLPDGTQVVLVSLNSSVWNQLQKQNPTGRISVKAFVQSKPNEWRLLVQEAVNR